MSGIIQRVPWTVQPQVPVPLDSGGLFGRRIAASYSFQFGRALRVDQQYRQITHTGTPASVVSKYKGLSNASGGNGWSDTDDGFRVKAASSGLTVTFGFSQASIVGSCRILSNDGTGYNWWIQRGGSGNLEVFVNSALQATATWPSSATAYHFWSVSMAAGGGTTIYLDGVLVGSGGSTPLTSVDRSLSWLADGSQVGAFYSTDLLYGVLSAQEHSALCANPWQNYAPLPRRIWAPAAAGGGTSISGALGTASASGFKGNVNATRSLTGALGTATASGFKGTVNANRTIAGALGVAAASGFQGNVGANRGIAGALGTAVASGFQGTVSNANSTTITGALGTAVASGFTGGIVWNRSIAGVLGTAQASGFNGGVSNGAPVVAGGGGWFPMPRRRTKKEIDDERRALGILPPEVVTEVAAAPVARRRITLQDLIGKKAAAQITSVDLSEAIAASKKRKRRQDDELLLLM